MKTPNPFIKVEEQPLERLECERIWSWERNMIRFYGFAMVMIVLATLLLWAYGTERAVRLAVVAGIAVLMASGAWVQFRERCPRCRSLLGRQSRIMLPMRCKVCRVEFPRQPRRGDETQPEKA